jgi:predicted NACHT family NTPase
MRWEMCSSTAGVDASSACDQFLDALTHSWSKAVARRVASGRSSAVVPEAFSVQLGNVKELNHLLKSMREKSHEALAGIEHELEWVRDYLEKGRFQSGKLSLTTHEAAINTLDEIARISGSECMLEESDGSATFDSTMLKGSSRSLFIVAPAGFGKTTFCRWNALDDLERLLQGGSNILPVYVPLHQIGDISNKNFNTFLRHAGVSALIPKEEKTHYDRIRVYLDGLDEVPNITSQKRIAQLAKKATEDDPSIEIIITARDYAYGVLMTWLSRVHLSAFDDEQITVLVTKWLDGDNERIAQFFDQLSKSRSLKEMMITPLLATLIVLVFKQTGKLPENKTRLYEIFVDLHNGGWDLAKGIQRPSRFSAGEKMFALKRVAASFHKAKRREMLDSDVAKIVRAALKDVDWTVLRNELLRDGLVIRLGEMISFSHHSFQEFLTARHMLGDLDARHLNQLCEEYLKGSDWWAEVLCFFMDITAKPQELRGWIDERLRSVLRFAREQRAAAAETRALILRNHLESSFPFARC